MNSTLELRSGSARLFDRRPSACHGGHQLANAQVEYKSAIGKGWLLLPISAFLIGILLVASLAVRGWWRNARALKRYKSGYL